MMLCLFKRVNFLQNPLLLVLGANLLVFYPAANSELLWDDGIVFDSTLLSAAEHPFVYWVRGSGFYKTWPTPFAVLKLLHLGLGGQYWLYKLFGILLHTANALLLFALLARFFSRGKSLGLALAFSLHPMQVETVLWIFQVNTLLASFFLLSAAWLLVARRGWWAYLLALGAFYFSVTSKAVALFFPLLLAFALFRKGERWQRVLLLPLPFLLLSCYHGWLAYRGTFSYTGEVSSQRQMVAPPVVIEKEDMAEKAVMPKNEVEFASKPLYQRAFNMEKGLVFVQNLGFYLRQALLPFPLLFMYPRQSPYWFWEVLAVLFLIGAFLVMRRRRPDLEFFGYSWLLAFIPISGLVYIAHFKFSFVANRYMYLGLVGLLGLLGSWIAIPRKVVVCC